jgi:hypothetical protein
VVSIRAFSRGIHGFNIISSSLRITLNSSAKRRKCMQEMVEMTLVEMTLVEMMRRLGQNGMSKLTRFLRVLMVRDG